MRAARGRAEAPLAWRVWALAIAAAALACSGHPQGSGRDGGPDGDAAVKDGGVTWPTCGNADCEAGETCETCPADCPLCPGCPSGVCDPSETCETCAADCGACGPACGNGNCETGETCETCPEDCPDCEACPNAACEPGETCASCAADCGACPPVCGNGNCEPTEDSNSCPGDCNPHPPLCGDARCDGGETCASCAPDCGACGWICGEGTCDPGESCASCPADCGACPLLCGDAQCEAGESCASCPADCGACPGVCGDGSCEAVESCALCPADCGPCPAVCGSLGCEPTEDCLSCPADCGPCPAGCGNAACDEYEDCSTCPLDCGPCPSVCGNGPCEIGETCASCPADCGPCPPVCGDGLCENLEGCEACPQDCGACVVEQDILSKCPFNPLQWWRGVRKRDVTFVAFGDPHATSPKPGCPRDSRYAFDQNEKMQLALNHLDTTLDNGDTIRPHRWPKKGKFERAGRVFDHVRGVIIVGDLTQAGSETIPAGGPQECAEYAEHRRVYGRCGNEGALRFPVYDGYGNHDFPRMPMQPKPWDAYFPPHPVVDYLGRLTKNQRPGAAVDLYDDPNPGSGHYAWRWDDIWFVQLNLKPGSNREYIEQASSDTLRVADPRGSLRFLRQFLRSLKKSTKRQIVVLSHYAIDNSRVEEAEQKSFCKLLHEAQRGQGAFSSQKLSKTAPVLAHIFGHDHKRPKHRKLTCPRPYHRITIDLFHAGTPWYRKTSYVDRSATGGHTKPRFVPFLGFTVFRIGSRWLEVVGVAAPAAKPAGQWKTLYKLRLSTPRKP